MVGYFSISCLFRMVENRVQWVFSGVYGPIENRLRESFWEELGSIKDLWDVPWCIGGDFNEILYLNERFSGGRFSNSMRRFFDILNDLELRDHPLQGGPYTWSGGINSRSMSRLDRFLVTADWESHYIRLLRDASPGQFSIISPSCWTMKGLEWDHPPFVSS